MVLSQFREAGRETGHAIYSVEKFALYYICLNPRLASARQMREFAFRAVERMPKNEDRVRYDHVFHAGDPENKAFWMQALPVIGDLANRFVAVEA